MANVINWQTTPTSRGNVLSTELNGLASAARSDAGTEVDNSANLDSYGCLEFNVDFTAAPASGSYVTIWLITAPDGTNYSDGSSTVDPGDDALLLLIPIRASSAAQKKITDWFPLPGEKIKFIMENNANKSFPNSGNTLELFTNNFEIQ